MGKPSVTVVMSTYNGEKYFEEQIDSIESQRNVRVSLIIRDDGSTDGTLELLDKVSSHYGNIRIIQGQNLGYANSFLNALRFVPVSDYYAFADQDDVWLPTKLEAAVKTIEQKKCLYASSLTLVDQNINVIGEKKYKGYRDGIGSILSRNRIAGCTIVFDSYLCHYFKDRVDEIISYNTFNYGHDGWILLYAKILNLKIYVDNRSFILYRRHQTTVTSERRGIKKRVQNELKIFTNNDNYRIKISKYLLEKERPVKYDRETLELITSYKNKLGKRLRLLLSGRIRTGIFVVDFKNTIAVLCGRY